MYNDDFDDEDYCGYEEDDNERDLFYTLTDGQYVEGTKRSVYLRESPKMMEEPRIEIVR